MRATFSVIGIVIASVGPSVVACGSEGDNNNAPKNDGGIGNVFDEAGNNPDTSVNIENDPFPRWCGPEAGKPQPPLPTGTEKCPSDKNVEGCPCTTVGEKASCWPGLRKNRGLGSCKDGTTECKAQGELGKVWSKCEGASLPSAQIGPGACSCFSGGLWNIANLVPCLVVSNGTDFYATSAACPPNPGDPPPAKGVPSAPWSTDTVKVDCEGRFKLCFTLKVGDAANPQPTDCTFTQVCTEGDYLTKNVEQKFPDLPGWFTDDDVCVKKAAPVNMGGEGQKLYFEMSVNGNSFFCDEVGSPATPLVFNRKPYCAIGDTSCSNSGSGTFP